MYTCLRKVLTHVSLMLCSQRRFVVRAQPSLICTSYFLSPLHQQVVSQDNWSGRHLAILTSLVTNVHVGCLRGNLLHHNVAGQSGHFEVAVFAALEPRNLKPVEILYLSSDGALVRPFSERLCHSLTFIQLSPTCPQHCSQLLPAPIIRPANFIHKISHQGFRQTDRKTKAPSWFTTFICRNQRGNMLFLLF